MAVAKLGFRSSLVSVERSTERGREVDRAPVDLDVVDDGVASSEQELS
jgi:hypothetical protein